MLRLTKKATTFMLMTLIISYVCFGFLLMSVRNFSVILESPLYMLVLAVGCMAPFISAVILKREESLLKQIFTIKKPQMAYLISVFIAFHYVLACLVKVVGAYGTMSSFLISVPVMLVLMGVSEIGWRLVLHEELLQKMGIWRSCICIGLISSLCFIPLLYIPGFLVDINSFLPFAIYIAGMGMLSTTIYTQSGGVLYSIIFVGLFTAFSSLFLLNMGNSLIIMFVIDFVLSVAYNSERLNKTKSKV